MTCSLHRVGRAHRAQLETLVRDSGFFREAEVGTAVELLDESLAGDEDYRFIGAFEGDQLVGYACWGPNPDTQGTFDLYWIVVARDRQGTGVGSLILQHVEQTVAAERGRLIVVETSGRTEYQPTRGFYEAKGYARVATVPDYYAPGDDLAIYTKDLTSWK